MKKAGSQKAVPAGPLRVRGRFAARNRKQNLILNALRPAGCAAA
jgi:hypothetical protein